MDLRSLSEDAPESQWREPMRDKVGAEQLQQVYHCTTQTGGSDCGPEGQRSAPSGSRRAATGVRNNRRVCSETMEDHDRRFWYRWPLTWRFSHAFTVLNTTQFHVRRLGTDLARRKPGVQIPSPPPPNQQVRASPTSSRRRSPPSGAALGPRTPMGGCSTSAGERLPKLVDRQSAPSLDWVNDLHSWPLIVLARGPAPVARGSAG
jgi:hypothetical protein